MTQTISSNLHKDTKKLEESYFRSTEIDKELGFSRGLLTDISRSRRRRRMFCFFLILMVIMALFTFPFFRFEFLKLWRSHSFDGPDSPASPQPPSPADSPPDPRGPLN